MLLDGVSHVPVTGTRTERIAAMASVQRGHVAWRQLIAAGVSTSAVSRLVSAGHLLPRHHGVYVLGHLAPVPGGPEAAALLALRPGGALSHATAARWWGIDDGRSLPDSAEEIHITLPGQRACGPAGVAVHRSTILTARDLRVHEGLPVTAPARTLLDLAAGLGPRELERTLDTALVRRRVTLREINELLGRAGRHAGRAVLRDLVDAHSHTTFTRSEAEERFLSLVRRARLPEPLVNVRRHGFELDFLWPGEPGRSVAVEIDGYAFHGGRLAFERDRRRTGSCARPASTSSGSPGAGSRRSRWPSSPRSSRRSPASHRSPDDPADDPSRGRQGPAPPHASSSTGSPSTDRRGRGHAGAVLRPVKCRAACSPRC